MRDDVQHAPRDPAFTHGTLDVSGLAAAPASPRASDATAEQREPATLRRERPLRKCTPCGVLRPCCELPHGLLLCAACCRIVVDILEPDPEPTPGAIEAERYLRTGICSHAEAVVGCEPCRRTTSALAALRGPR